MRHLRSDYDAIQPWPIKRTHLMRAKSNGMVGQVHPCDDEKMAACDPIIPDDEPVFLLRGQDPSAGPAVRAWADDVEARGGNPEHVARVREWAKEMESYARNREGGMKQVADVPEGALR